MQNTLYTAHSERYRNGMQYQRCGYSGVLLPRLSLGLWHNFGADREESTCRDIAHYAFDHGITHFDLANNYGPPPGSAEETFGRLLTRSFAPYRDELFIATKAGYDMWEGPYGSWNSRKHIMASLDQSLRRLHTDYVDLFYSHRYDPETPMDETLQTLVDVVKQGKALYVGLSRWPRQAAEYAFDYLSRAHTPCLIYQGRLNLFDRAPIQEGILDSVRNRCGFISFSPLAQGLLTNRYLNGIPAGSRMEQERFLKSTALTPQVLRRIQALNKLAGERGETLAGMALAWILHHPEVTSVLIGASSTTQLADNLSCLHAAPFSEEELSHIENILTE